MSPAWLCVTVLGGQVVVVILMFAVDKLRNMDDEL